MIARQTILVADDHADVVKLVSANLTGAGLRVVAAHTGGEALEAARRLLPALVILELQMPGISGAEVLRTLKSESKTAAIAVLILSEAKEEVDRIVCFELGADDYVTKPFSMRELALRVKAILARAGGAPSSRYAEVGAISLDREGLEVRVSGEKVVVTALEFKLLKAFFTQPGRVFSREELIDLVWGQDTVVEHRTVDTHLRRLRERLGPAARQIQTVRGFGYRLEPE